MAFETFQGPDANRSARKQAQLTIRADLSGYLNAAADVQHYRSTEELVFLTDTESGRLAIADADVHDGYSYSANRGTERGLEVYLGTVLKHYGLDEDDIESSTYLDLEWNPDLDAGVVDLTPLLEETTAEPGEPSAQDATATSTTTDTDGSDEPSRRSEKTTDDLRAEIATALDFEYEVGDGEFTMPQNRRVLAALTNTPVEAYTGQSGSDLKPLFADVVDDELACQASTVLYFTRDEIETIHDAIVNGNATIPSPEEAEDTPSEETPADGENGDAPSGNGSTPSRRSTSTADGARLTLQARSFVEDKGVRKLSSLAEALEVSVGQARKHARAADVYSDVKDDTVERPGVSG